MNRKVINPQVLLLCFLVGFIGFLTARFIQVCTLSPFLPQISTFTFTPPSQALSGILTSTNGHVEKLSRNENEFKEASQGATILLGESVATKTKSDATVTIANFAKIQFGPAAEVNFANLFSDNMVLQQKSGDIRYSTTKPLSIRALHTLISITSGTTIINIIDTDISVAVQSGLAKFALVDTDNNTRTYQLSEGQWANINDTTRKVYLVTPR